MKTISSVIILLNVLLVVALLLLTGCGGSGKNQTIANVASVEYSADSSGCLTSQNAEAVINYTNGKNMSKTLIWNCAALNGRTQKQRVEEFFVSDDGGQCFSHYQEKVSDAICTERAIAPAKPVFEAKISSFNVSPMVEGDLAGYEVITQITNTGNATLFDLEANYSDQNLFLNQGTRWLIIAPGATLNDHQAVEGTSPPSKTFDITVSLKMWDGTVLDSQTQNVVLP